jgi:hypothetical protein
MKPVNQDICIKLSYWMRFSNKISITPFRSSSCGGYESAESDRYHEDSRTSRTAGHSVEHLIEVVTLDNEKDQPKKQVEVSDQPKNPESKKKSFWKMLTGNSKKSKENATTSK